MRVFVTGATGFVGLAVVHELIGAGHLVLGLARSDAGAELLSSVGATVQRGSLDDLESLQHGARVSDGTIHLAFVHDWANIAESCAVDRRAIETLGAALAGTDKPLIVTSGLAGLAQPDRLATEADEVPADFPFPRVSEQTALALKDVRAAVVRLPQVHDRCKQGLVTFAIALFRAKGECAYAGDGANRWAAAHVSDVARLYRLAIESAEAGAKYHAVAEEGVSQKAIVETLAHRLDLPVRSLPPEEVQAFFGSLGLFVASDLSASSAWTRQSLGWEPKGPSLLADLAQLELTIA
jgi:nucleoside-diphosphate-sugar epimerase